MTPRAPSSASHAVADTLLDEAGASGTKAATPAPGGTPAHPTSDVTTAYAPTVTPTAVGAGVDAELAPDQDSFAARYEPLEVLGVGGMGEVRLHRDRRIGRDVAVKIIRSGQGSRSDMRARFLREARVQGQLEHPALAPVYDLGAHPSGGAFFTMKRVRGLTLEEILGRLRDGDAPLAEEFTTRRLLTAFSSACLAVHYAHARGVVHRDLKPGNIMLGGFGEVYVLDWGLARVMGQADPALGGDVKLQEGGDTAAGAVMGTPGYMPPEQLADSHVDARADVYALGAILFEILTLEGLHPHGSLDATLASTIRGADARATVRVPTRDVPPELEAVCVRATATRPEDRYPSARELSDAVEGFLDGDRDVAMRRAMAEQLTTRAGEAVERALGGGAGGASERAQAMSEIGRALALDPENRSALGLLYHLLAELPREIPAEVRRAIDEDRARAMGTVARGGTFAYLAWLLYLPLVFLMGVRSWPLTFGMVFAILTAAGSSFWLSWRGTRGFSSIFLVLLASSVGIGLSTRIFGPFLVAPTVALANLLTFCMQAERRHRAVAAFMTLLALFVPAGLEWFGVLDPSYTFEHGTIVVHPHLASFDNPDVTCVLLFAAVLGLVIAPMFLFGWTRIALNRREEEAELRAWHLRQLLPRDARLESSAPPAADAGCLTDALRSKAGTPS